MSLYDFVCQKVLVPFESVTLKLSGMFPWILTGIPLATEWGSAWVMQMTVREKMNIRGHIDSCYLKWPPKGVLEVSCSTSAQARIITNTISSQWWLCLARSWKLPRMEIPQQLWAPIPVLHYRDHEITWIEQGRSHWSRGEGRFGCSRVVLVPLALLFPWLTSDTELHL